MKIYKARLRTAGTADKLLKQTGSGTTPPEIQAWTEFYNILDDAIIYVANIFGDGYSLHTWPPEADARIKEAIYLSEQDGMFGTYLDDREGFERDWAAGEYSPCGSIVFKPDEVEILQEIRDCDALFKDMEACREK